MSDPTRSSPADTRRFETLLDGHLGDGLEDAELDEFLALLHDEGHPERLERLETLLEARERLEAAGRSVQLAKPASTPGPVPKTAAPSGGWRRMGGGLALLAAGGLIAIGLGRLLPGETTLKGAGDGPPPEARLYLDGADGEAVTEGQVIRLGTTLSPSVYCQQRCVAVVVRIAGEEAVVLTPEPLHLAPREVAAAPAWQVGAPEGPQSLVLVVADPDADAARDLPARALGLALGEDDSSINKMSLNIMCSR